MKPQMAGLSLRCTATSRSRGLGHEPWMEEVDEARKSQDLVREKIGEARTEHG